MKKIIDCFKQRHGKLFSKDANVSFNSDESGSVLFDVACILNCHVWRNSGEIEEEICDRQLKFLRNIISCYEGMEILASITENEIVERFLSIVKYGFICFNLSVIGVCDFRAKIFGLKDDNP